MLKRSILLKPGVRNVKSVKKPIKGSEKKAKTVLTKTKPKREKKTKTPENEDKPSKEIKELQSKFNIKAQTVKKAVQGIITLTAEDPNLKKKLFNEQFPLFLQVNSIKVPKIHSKIVRLPLKHSILSPDSDICLIVPDVKGIPNKEHEEHQEHYEKLLQSKNVTNIKKIMTFHEFRTEYDAFELKRRLVELYDFFLVDGRISGKTVKKCGKIFYTKRKVPTAIKLQATKLKEQIDQALKKTPLYLSGKGDSFMVQIGRNTMEEKHIVENVFSVLKELDKQFPGGFNNIRSLNLYTVKGITIPLYVTLKNQTGVVIPKQVKKQNAVGTVVDELSTKFNSGVIVKPTGEVKLYRLRRKDEGEKQLSDKSEDVGESNEARGNKRKLEDANDDNSQASMKKRKNSNAQAMVKKPPTTNKRKATKKLNK